MGFGELEGEATVVRNMFGREISLVSAMLLDVPVSPVKCSPSTSGKVVYAHRLQHCGPGGVSCLLCMPNAHWLHRLLTMQSVPCSGSGAFLPVCLLHRRSHCGDWQRAFLNGRLAEVRCVVCAVQR